MSSLSNGSSKTIRKPFEPATRLSHVRFVMYEIASLAKDGATVYGDQSHQDLLKLARSVNDVLNGTPNSVNSLAAQCVPVRWEIRPDIAIVRTTAIDQPESYAVRCDGDTCELSHSGDWEMSLLDSKRDPEWLKDHRWPTFEKALEAVFAL